MKFCRFIEIVCLLIWVHIFLTACGSEASYEASPYAGAYTRDQLEPWKEICFGEQLDIDAYVLNCEALTPEMPCEEQGALYEEQLELAWEHAVASANALLEDCASDWRSGDCYAQYEGNLDFYVNLYCEGVI